MTMRPREDRATARLIWTATAIISLAILGAGDLILTR